MACAITVWCCAAFAVPSVSRWRDVRHAWRIRACLAWTVEEAGVLVASLVAGWPELRRIDFFEGSADVPCMAAAGLPHAAAGVAVAPAAQLASADTARFITSGGGAAAAAEAADVVATTTAAAAAVSFGQVARAFALLAVQ